jgi:antitoxin ParD1/3/4
MTTFTITLPDPLGDFVNDRVAQGDFASPSDFIASIVGQAHAESSEAKKWMDNLSPAAQERLEAMLIEGLESGPPIRVDDEFWRDLKEKVQRRDFGAPPELQV